MDARSLLIFDETFTPIIFLEILDEAKSILSLSRELLVYDVGRRNREREEEDGLISLCSSSFIINERKIKEIFV